MTPTKPKPFSEKEKQLLCDRCQYMTVAEFQRQYMPEKSVEAIRSFAIRIGMPFKSNIVKWNNEELSILKKYYSQYGAERVVIELAKKGYSRTRQQVVNCANKKGFKLNKNVYASVLSNVDKEKLFAQAEVARPYWKSKIHEKCYYLLDRHWAGERFAKGTEEYRILKQFGIIGY